MSVGFGNIPREVIEFIRHSFKLANDKASSTLTVHPSTHEEQLDFLLIHELSARPPTFFANSKAGVVLNSHWLGGRRMFERWEIADIAVLITIKSEGRTVAKKVVLLQTKRLYSNELAGAELEEYDYFVGIGRLVEREDSVPLFPQRKFHFKPTSRYGALIAGDMQPANIDKYAEERNIEVFYGFYNPQAVPFTGNYPWSAETPLPNVNTVGCRVIPAKDVHGVLAKKKAGRSPSFDDLLFCKFNKDDDVSTHGWRLEDFIANEVMTCRRGRLFTQNLNRDLHALLYERTRPIEAAIVITIDLASGG